MEGVRGRLRAHPPNPFANRTSPGYVLPAPGIVRLSIFDASGRLVRTLVDGSQAAGTHSTEWDGTDRNGTPVRSGAYLYKLSWNGRTATGRKLFVR